MRHHESITDYGTIHHSRAMTEIHVFIDRQLTLLYDAVCYVRAVASRDFIVDVDFLIKFITDLTVFVSRLWAADITSLSHRLKCHIHVRSI